MPLTLEHILFELSHMTSSKPRILLISSQHLFGESMEMILRAETGLELIGPWDLNEQEVCGRLRDARPSVVVIADEDLQSEAATGLTRSIIEKYPEISVIRTALNEKVFRIFSTHTLPARGADLLETIHSCIARTEEMSPSDDSNIQSGDCKTHEP